MKRGKMTVGMDWKETIMRNRKKEVLPHNWMTGLVKSVPPSAWFLSSALMDLLWSTVLTFPGCNNCRGATQSFIILTEANLSLHRQYQSPHTNSMWFISTCHISSCKNGWTHPEQASPAFSPEWSISAGPIHPWITDLCFKSGSVLPGSVFWFRTYCRFGVEVSGFNQTVELKLVKIGSHHTTGELNNKYT